MCAQRGFGSAPKKDEKKTPFLTQKKELWNQELAKYKHIVKPERPYNFKEYKYREVDPTLPRSQRFQQRTKYLFEDSRTFLGDILRGDSNKVMFRVAYSLRRQRDRFYKLTFALDRRLTGFKDTLVGGVQHTVHGLKDFSEDSKWLLRQKIRTEEFNNASYRLKAQERRAWQDVLKMIPFSFFIIVPGAELLLPVYLSIFPNALPSQFLSESDKMTNFESRRDKQENAAKQLQAIWPNYLTKLLNEPGIDLSE